MRLFWGKGIRSANVVAAGTWAATPTTKQKGTPGQFSRLPSIVGATMSFDDVIE
jgi:hypothetical protein